MNILEIYKKYELPEHLQMHMLRVAACCKLILENWKENITVNKESLLRIALLHDMGNMAKISDEQVDNPAFAKIRKEYIDKYGKDDHKINIVIGKQEGLTEKELAILDKKQLKRNKEIKESSDYILKICAYCDQRVAPNGVESLKGRLEELQQRHKNKPNGSMHNPKVAKELTQYALQIEKQVIHECTLLPNEINNETIAKYIEELKKYNLVQSKAKINVEKENEER